ncbi:MAG: FAD-dependent oxidoreductase [Bacteroidota bacterium]
MPNLSYWESQTYIGRPGLIIVGAGFVGVRTALSVRARERELGLKAIDILIIERHSFGLGASTRNAGFACFGSPTEILADLKQGDTEAVWETIKRRYQGVNRLRKELTGTTYWKDQGGYEVFSDRETYEYVQDKLPALNRELSERLDSNAQWLPADKPSGLKSGFPVLHNKAEAKLQPAALLHALQQRCREQGVRFLYGCTVHSFSGGVGNMKLETDSFGQIECDQLLLATNAFSRQLGISVDLKPQRNLVLLTGVIPGLELPGTYHHHEGYVYFRTVESKEGARVLIGGARHLDKAAETTDFLTRNNGADVEISDPSMEKIMSLRKSLKNYLSVFLQTREEDLNIQQSWMGILAQGSKKTPVVKAVQSGLFIAVRLAGMGVALSAEVGAKAAELLLEEVH